MMVQPVWDYDVDTEVQASIEKLRARGQYV